MVPVLDEPSARMRLWSASAFDQIDGGITLHSVAAICCTVWRHNTVPMAELIVIGSPDKLPQNMPRVLLRLVLQPELWTHHSSFPPAHQSGLCASFSCRGLHDAERISLD